MESSAGEGGEVCACVHVCVCVHVPTPLPTAIAFHVVGFACSLCNMSVERFTFGNLRVWSK